MPVNRYAQAKEHQGREYRGMKVGGTHRWTYPDGHWTERKITPQRWEVAFTSLKRRRNRAPDDSGAEVGSGYHWLIVAHQWVGKMDANTYATHLEGSKHLLSFRKPGWQGWTTQQRGHTSARLRTIMALEELIAELRERPDEDFEDPADEAALLRLLEQQPGATAALPSAARSALQDDGPVAKRRAPRTARAPKAGGGRRPTTRPNRLTSRARPRQRAAVATPTRRPSRR